MKNEFEKLGLGQDFADSLKKMGLEKPTEIQEKAIPLVLAGKDIIGGSATGSGKTLVFASAIIENLKPNQHVQALVLTPTRELADQVALSIKKFSRTKRLDVLAVYGGVSIDSQIRKLSTADVVVGTPGRILDHLNRGTLRLGYVKFLVLDEVDRMFDMGFHFDVEKIIGHCPKKRQTMLFSATISPSIDHLASKHTKDAIEVSVESYVDSSYLKQIFYDVPSHLKFSLLVYLLRKEKSGLVMVFCATRRNVDFVVANLKRQGINSQAIHGGLAQNKRTRVMESFHRKGADILVCTDVAARGLDIKGVSHVYNYDIPKSSSDYIHRIGRTARAGKNGKAINILASRDYENFKEVQKDDSLKIERVELPLIPTVRITTDFGKKSRGRFSGQRSGGFSNGRRQSTRGRERNSRSRFGRRKPVGKSQGRFNSGRNRKSNFRRR